MADNIIELKDATKIYNGGKPNQVDALRELCLTVERGASLAVMGVSGSGKTTLLNVLGCMDTLTRGTYLLAGRDVSALTGARLAEVRGGTIGYVLQEYGLLVNDTVQENVELPLYFSKKYAGREARLRVAKCLADMGLADKAKEKVRDLSGGQRQRVAIARAMANDPDILLADEPTGALDHGTASEIMDIFSKLNERRNKTVILVTHDPEVAGRMRRVLTMRDGKLTEG